MAATKIRKSVPLTAADTQSVASLRGDISWQEAALEIAGIELSPDPSEAEALHALVAVGRSVLADRVSEKTMASGYAALAESYTDEDRDLSRASGRRTARRAS
jgi:hypothetical protein